MNVRSKRGRPVVDDKRRRILDAALSVFAERGYHGTSVPDVAGAAKVSTGTLYHYFEHKQELVNEVYRDAKDRLRTALLADLADPDLDRPGAAEQWFLAVWDRLATFALSDPESFRFLEMQDHAPYLDAASRQLEIATIAPLFVVGKRMSDRGGLSGKPEITMALMWGAFVGVVKASRLGYLRLDAASLREAGVTCWRMLTPEVRVGGGSRTSSRARPRTRR
jgi:AcrR family transcriptional regulator